MAAETLQKVLQGKKITVCICGGIAAYKMAETVALLKKQGAEVRVAMTPAACHFITPLTLRTLSGQGVATDILSLTEDYPIPHIDLAACDLMIVAPATANILAKAAHGLGDELVSAAILATEAPVLFAPAMNCNMYHKAATQENLALLVRRGYHFIGPDSGRLACDVVGKGRMSEPGEIVRAAVKLLVPEQPFKGLNIVVSAGPTRERIDPVRYLSNFSSGKMGYALAEAAAALGGHTTLVSGPVALPPPEGIQLVPVESAGDMQAAMEAAFPAADIVIMAAAVADYRPAAPAEQKLKKGASASLNLVANPDILAALGEKKGQKLLIGFAAETQDMEKYALGKLKAKHLDIIVANDISQAGAGFEVDTNIIALYTADGKKQAYPLQSKKAAAEEILAAISRLPGFAALKEGKKEA